MSSLATRCPECGTVFRVVQDQLRVSEGWVRCGRCTAVFNAVENFVELEARPAAAPPPEPMLGPTSEPVSERAPEPVPASEPLPDATPLPESAVELQPAAETAFAASAEPLAADPPQAEPAPATLADPQVEPDARTAPLPSFVRQADRAARWRSRPMRIASAAGIALLATALAAQAALTWRDHLAARVPALKPALQAACGVLECTLGAPRRIAALAVDGSGLGRVEKSSLYKLSLTLKNRSDLALAIPALDVSLTDSDGRLVARRVLTPAELGLPGGDPTIAAGADLPLLAVLQLDRAAPAVSGYTVELFYP